MIIQSKIQGQGLWSVIVLCGSLVAACSGTIETPTEEFPPRQGSQASDDDDNGSPRPPANQPSASANDDDDDAPSAPVASDDDDEPLPTDDEEDPAGDEEDPAGGDEPAPAGDVSFASDISPIFTTSCGGCHGPGGFGGVSIADSDVDAAFENAKEFEEEVIEKIEDGLMPPPCSGGAPGDPGCIPADDFAAVQAWYEAGAPE